MKLATTVLATLALSLSLSGCLIEAERPTVTLQNNSDQTVILQGRVYGKPVPKATATAHSTMPTDPSPPKGHCVSNWEVADTAGTVLKKVDTVCAYDTVTYP